MKDAAPGRTRTLPLWPVAPSRPQPPKPPAPVAISIGMHSATVHVERRTPRR